MRIKLTIAVALTALAAAGGGTAEAHGAAHARAGATSSHRTAPLAHTATPGSGDSRGGKALTEKEYWRAQWRDEGAVFPGDK